MNNIEVYHKKKEIFNKKIKIIINDVIIEKIIKEKYVYNK